MGKRDPRVDAYIANAADFAQPILTDIREAVHAACPDVEETMKWRFPHFVYKGMLCGVAAFKQHAAFGFWKGSLVTGRGRGARRDGPVRPHHEALRSAFEAVLARLVKKAAELNEQGVKVPRAPKKARAKDGDGSVCSCRGLAEEQEGPGRLQPHEPEPQARIHRVDHGGEEPTRPVRAGSRRRSSGWRRVSRGIGNTREGDRACGRPVPGAARQMPGARCWVPGARC